MIQVSKSNQALGFSVSGEIYQRAKQWAYSIDEMVFNEQLATGRFGDWEVGPAMQALMRKVKEEGGILPYYGVGGSSGACTYQFHFRQSLLRFTVIHTVTNDVMEMDVPYSILSEPLEARTGRRFKFSPTPYLTNEKLPEAWSGEPPEALICKIIGRELEKLTRWQCWVDKDALSERYIYEFGEVSMGETGFTVKVKDTKIGKKIDVSDYDNW